MTKVNSHDEKPRVAQCASPPFMQGVGRLNLLPNFKIFKGGTGQYLNF